MRTLTAEMQTDLVQPVVRFRYLVLIEFDNFIAAWTTAYKNIIYNEVEYIAVGHFGTISPFKETEGVKANGLTLTLSGVDESLVSLLLSTPYLNRNVKVFCYVTDEHENLDINKIKLMFRGKLDSIEGSVGNNPSFSVQVRSRLADWERTRSLKYTDADQQYLFPGDKGMEYIPQLSQKKLVWPRASFLTDVRDYKPKEKS